MLRIDESHGIRSVVSLESIPTRAIELKFGGMPIPSICPVSISVILVPCCVFASLRIGENFRGLFLETYFYIPFGKIISLVKTLPGRMEKTMIWGFVF